MVPQAAPAVPRERCVGLPTGSVSELPSHGVTAPLAQKCCRRHRWQKRLPSCLYVPSSHDKHSADPGVDTVPKAHRAHVALEVARVRLENLSAGHLVHNALPAGSCAKVPGRQSPQTSAWSRSGNPAVDVPSGHAEQLLQSLAPSAVENVPSGQARHCAMRTPQRLSK